jgi:hypothetical protein
MMRPTGNASSIFGITSIQSNIAFDDGQQVLTKGADEAPTCASP